MFKYAAQLGACKKQPCPNHSRYAPRQVRAYRWMNHPPTSNDFVPVAIRDSMPNPSCDHWNLSFFDTVPNAEAKWNELDERVDAENRYGGHIGAIDLTHVDGASCLPASTGHFGLHEYHGAPALEQRVVTIVPISRRP
jgi:hypothetical protein